MATIKIEAGDIPAKVNSATLQAEIAAALNVKPSDIALELVLGELRIIRSSNLGTEEEIIPPFIGVTVPDGVLTDSIPAVVAAHNPAKSDAETVADSEATRLKENLISLANDPDMIALIKAAAAS